MDWKYFKDEKPKLNKNIMYIDIDGYKGYTYLSDTNICKDIITNLDIDLKIILWKYIDN